MPRQYLFVGSGGGQSFLPLHNWLFPLWGSPKRGDLLIFFRPKSWIQFPNSLECARVQPICIADLILEITKWRIITLNKHTGRFLNTAILDEGLAPRIVLFSWTKIQILSTMDILNIYQMAAGSMT